MKDNKDVKMMPYYLIKGSQEEFNKMMKFSKYEEVPANIAEKVIAAAKAEKENE